MDPYLVALLLLGIAVLGVAWLPTMLARYPLSYPVLYLGLGAAAYALPLGLPAVHPISDGGLVTHLAELCVLVALTSTGLKIDRPFRLRTWRVPLVLVLVLMPLTIGAMTLAGWLVGFAPATALLLAACLAPTDPVLAGDVQVGDPGAGREDNVRFGLTGEAGLNDGLAFPFVWLALTPGVFRGELGPLGWWLVVDVGYRLAAGLVVGLVAGKLLAWLIFTLSRTLGVRHAAYGFVALAVTLCTYSLTEAVRGYGFLAVFVAALMVRSYERHHELHKLMHAFTDQLERLLTIVLLMLFGGALVGGLLAPLSWSGALLGLGLVLIVRPVLGYLVLAPTHVSRSERGVLAAFGIRGIGSIFYLAFALGVAPRADAAELWAIVGFTVLLSVVLHGVASTPVMDWLDRRHGRHTTVEHQEAQGPVE